MRISLKREKRYKRCQRVRAKVFGTGKRPRLCVFLSSKHIYAQLINDEKGATIAAASDLELNPKLKEGKLKVEIAREVGKLIAKKALERKFVEPLARSGLQSSAIEKVVFDKRWYQYHGRVKALAEGAKEGGLKF